jgi:hypothetical protein
MVEENSQLLDIRPGLANNLLDTTHEIVNFDGVGAKRHPQCRLETVEVLMMVDDVLSFEMLGRILKYLITVMLEESFLRNMMEGFVDDECLPHIESKLVDVVGRNSEQSSFMSGSVAFSIYLDIYFSIGYRTSSKFQE